MENFNSQHAARTSRTTLEDVRNRLVNGGFAIASDGRLPNDRGTQIRLTNDAIVNVFDTGTVQCQGRNADAVKAVLDLPTAGATAPARDVSPKRKVFVVYGHDQPARDQLEAMLRRWKLEPLILDQLPTEGQTVIEKLESAMKEVDFGVVLATPDDEGYRAGKLDEKSYRARQNVVLEMGMLLAKLGRENVAILLKTQEKMERPSDISGLIYIPFQDNIAKETGVSLAKAMVAHGYAIDVARL
jgi:predicted nucleotide-binding protein